MIEPRVYRAAFVPALLALVLVMFSLESQPAPLPQGLAADVLFDGEAAMDAAAAIARATPDRRPGTPGDLSVAASVERAFRARGFVPERQRFSEAGKDMVNVIGRRAGRSRRQIVLVAARDASSNPDATGSAADTAALLEFSRVLAGRPSRKTLVLASVDGSTLGQLGAARLADALGGPDQVDAVLVVSNLGSRERKGPLIVPWSNDSGRPGIGLQRTVADSLRQEVDEPVGGTGALGQLARLGFPIGVGAQGVMLERGFDSVRISGSGELPHGGRSPKDLDEDRLGGLGRAALRSVTALDGGPPPRHGPGSYVIAGGQVVPEWIPSLLALAFLLPALVAAVDAFARARRRRHPVAPWFRWVAASIVPFAAGLALGELLVLAGATPEPPPAPVAPGDYPLDPAAVAVLAGVAAVTGLLWLGARFLAVRGDPSLRDRSAPGAACATALVVAFTVLALWVVSPYAALLLVPAVHLWMLAALAEPPPTRRTRLLLVAGGLLPPAAVAVYYMIALSTDPLAGAWYLFLLVTGHTVGLSTAVIGCVLLGTLVSVVGITRVRDREAPRPVEDAPRVYGPGAYAGPGSLGGTESALRR